MFSVAPAIPHSQRPTTVTDVVTATLEDNYPLRHDEFQLFTVLFLNLLIGPSRLKRPDHFPLLTVVHRTKTWSEQQRQHKVSTVSRALTAEKLVCVLLLCQHDIDIVCVYGMVVKRQRSILVKDVSFSQLSSMYCVSGNFQICRRCITSGGGGAVVSQQQASAFGTRLL